MKKIIAFPLAHLCFHIGDFISKWKIFQTKEWPYIIYSRFMDWSGRLQDWANLKGPWQKVNKKDDALKCPNCGNDSWYEGPGGGSFGNIQCGNCETKYNNLGPFGLQEIS